jgi:hypothetical protein
MPSLASKLFVEAMPDVDATKILIVLNQPERRAGNLIR